MTRAAPSDAGSGTVPASPQRVQFPLADSMRAVAALSVLSLHVGEDSGLTGVAEQFNRTLAVGVPLFFVISGFLLYRPFVAARLSGLSGPSTGVYAVRRALRIVPAYWVALTGLTLVFGLPGVFTGDWWRYYFFLQIYDAATFDQGMGVAWTLCVEVGFYLLLPLYAAAAAVIRGSIGRRVATEVAVLSGLAVAAVGFNAWVVGTGLDVNIARTLPGTFDWFALGMILAVLSAGGVRPRPTLLLGCWPAAAAAFLVVSLVVNAGPEDLRAHLARHVLYGLIGVLLMAPVALGGGGRLVVRLMSTRVLTGLGLVSYSLYLYHATLIPPLVARGVTAWASLMAAALAVGVAAATLSFLLVERPFLRLKPQGRAVRAPRAARG